MKLTFRPEICNQGEYEGTLTIQMLTFDERTELVDELDVGESDIPNESDSKEVEKAKTKKGISMLRVAAKKLKEKFVSSTITRKADGFVFDSWEKLQYDSDMAAVIREAALKLVGKFQVTDPS